MDQHRYDACIAVEPGLDLKPHEVARVVKAPPALIIAGGQPVPADDDEQHVALSDPARYHLSEFGTDLDAVNVDKHGVAAKPIEQRCRQPVRRVRYVVTAIADKNVWDRAQHPGGVYPRPGASCLTICHRLSSTRCVQIESYRGVR